MNEELCGSRDSTKLLFRSNFRCKTLVAECTLEAKPSIAMSLNMSSSNETVPQKITNQRQLIRES